MQRLYPAILFNVLVLSLLIYGFQSLDHIEVSPGVIFGLFSVISFCSIIVLVSRRRMINSVEDYSNYLKKIVNNPGVGYVLMKITDKAIKIIDYNSESLRLLSCNTDSLTDIICSLFSESEIKELKHLRLGNEFEKTVTLKQQEDVRFLDFDISIISLKNGMYWLLRAVDVSDKIKEKEELAIREEKYRNLYFRNQSGVFTVDINSTILDCNQAFEEMFEGEKTKGRLLFENHVYKEWQEILELIGGKESLRNYQTHFTLKNGNVKWFIFNCYLDKSTNQVEGTIMDLSEVQKASAALRQSEQKYRLIYEESNDAILLLDEDRIIDVNRRGIQLFGIPQQKLLNNDLYELTFAQNDDTRREYKKFKQKLYSSRSTKFNWVFNGNDQKIEAEVAIIELMIGDKTYYQCVIHDLTQRNEVMRSLEKNRKSFKSVLDNSPEGIMIICEEDILYINDEVRRLISTDVIQLNHLFKDEEQEEFMQILKEHRETRGIKQRQFKLSQPGQTEIPVEVTLVSTTFEDRDSTLIIIKNVSLQNQLSKEMMRAEIAEETNKKLAKEIKERIKAEKLLQEQFLRSNAIFESSSNTLLLTLDTSFNISSFNTHCQNYFWYVTSRRIEKNNSFIDFFSQLFKAEDLRYFRKILGYVKEGESRQIESHFYSKGTERWLELFINPIFDIEGDVTEISLVAHDITEKKISDKEIYESLREKEVLLKEIHHRVKNNLQVISSILNLQSSFVKDAHTLEILEESRNRIRSMAMIHENLYRTTNFSSIDFKSYMENLSTNLIASYHVQSAKVHLRTEMDEVELVLDQAIPCGLLVNELITNALKYAFVNRKEGEVFISMKEENSNVLLVIEDNGVGLPKDFDMLKTDTLGLQLVATLTEQLDGQISVTTERGTKYLLTFEKAKL
jgi:PAS domain S-box-containing protein